MRLEKLISTPLLLTMGALSVGCSGEDGLVDEVASIEQQIVNGTVSAKSYGTVALFTSLGVPYRICSGILVTDKWVLTARHCLTTTGTNDGPLVGSASQVFGSKLLDVTSGIPEVAMAAREFVVHPDASRDLALVRFSAGLGAAAALYNGDTYYGDTLSLGYGNFTTAGGGTGILRQANFYSEPTAWPNLVSSLPNSSGQTSAEGDSGGPVFVLEDVLGRSLRGVLGVHSGRGMDGTMYSEAVPTARNWIKRTIFVKGDVNGDGKADITLSGTTGWGSIPSAISNGNGAFSIINQTVVDFPGWASLSGVKKLSGDFNGDGKSDVALTGASGWGSIPIALAKGDGTYTIKNKAVSQFPGWAAAAGAQAVPGDFNGDGYDDIALTGVSGWGSIPVAFSDGKGGFSVKNHNHVSFPGWAAQSNVTAVPGDFDGDGRDDIALVGGPLWSGVRVAFSNGNGKFTLRDAYMSMFPYSFGAVAAADGVVPISGDFDGDGRDDIALLGSSSTGVPIAYSRVDPDHSFEHTLVSVNFSWFVASARVGGVQVVAGDFTGDGRDDIALTGPTGWSTVPVAAMNSTNSSFTVLNQGLDYFPGWAALAGSVAMSGHKSQ